ncbi:MAG TPA: anaerobic glycerol-3-phosphate dehydrogenase subunit GlpC [Spirochaetota bacterium]|nr:anaerobic glycerol-3-phosphate dehydrogenase subunit GlpC [Spirochaetota bacterium]HPS86072.1 anaerobic glycerol-3-phosphate dehydrogenase subunit GlpC [Spirochaetota bacterium]
MIKIENISFDHCIKCTVCSMYCPVSQATHLFPGPKASGPDAERLRIKNPELVDSSLKFCTNCKRCEIACPSDVKIAEIIQNAKWNYLKIHWFRPRDFFMSRTDLVGGMATLFSTIVNFIIGLAIVRVFMHVFLKIPYRTVFPAYEKTTFRRIFKKELRWSQSEFSKKIIYFHGCYVNYNNNRLGREFVKVMNALGYGVEMKKEKCCGVPLIANGYIEKAKKNALYNISSLQKGNNESKIVATSSSCTFALKNEYSSFLELDNSGIADRVEFATKFIYNEFLSGNIPKMKPLGIRAAYHSPCHLERMGGVMYTLGVLKNIPGLELIVLNSECCGIAGTYGFKKENYDISLSVGKNLFTLIDKAVPEFVITDCETCKMQIEMNTKYKVLHPVTVIAMALDRK